MRASRCRASPSLLWLACMAVFCGVLPARAQNISDPAFWLPDFGAVVERGGNALLLTGYTWHDPATYGRGNGLNASNWGGGYARYFDHENGTSDMLYAMGFSDSNRNFQFVAGFERQWQVFRMEFAAVAIGYSAGITMREDIWGGAPLPFVLPVLGLRFFDRLDVFMTYVPPIPSDQFNGNKGNIAFMFLGLRF